MTSNYTIEVIQPLRTLEIETIVGDVPNSVDIINYGSVTVQASTAYSGTVVHATNVIGLDQHITNLIDTYTIDCGGADPTPAP